MSKASDLAALRKTPCLVCRRTPSDACHIRTKKASGDNELRNLMPLCRKCHQAQHRYGVITFIKRFQRVHDYVKAKGWSIEEVNGKEYLRRIDD